MCKKAMAVFISLITISMCCSIKSYAISMNLELSGDNITCSNGVYMCSKMIPVGGKMNIKIGADELIYHLRKNDKCKEIDDITLGNKIAKFY